MFKSIYNRFLDLEFKILETYIQLSHLDQNCQKYHITLSRLKKLLERENKFLNNEVFINGMDSNCELLNIMYDESVKEKDIDPVNAFIYHNLTSRFTSIINNFSLSNLERLVNALKNDIAKKALIIFNNKYNNADNEEEREKLRETYYLYIYSNKSLENEFINSPNTLNVPNVEHKEIKKLYIDDYDKFLSYKSFMISTYALELVDYIINASIQSNPYDIYCLELAKVTLRSYITFMNKEEYATFKSKTMSLMDNGDDTSRMMQELKKIINFREEDLGISRVIKLYNA